MGRWIKAVFSLLLTLLMSMGTASAEWFVFTTDAVPERLRTTVMQVGGYTGEIRLSFLGDCTLGGEKNNRSFARMLEKNGAEWFFGGVTSLTGQDTLTLVNLEGVLTDRDLTAQDKQYCFKGPSSYTEILTKGSVECVTLSNNHSLDYGQKGLSDTKAALDGAGIAYVSEDTLMVWVSDGVRVGFTASSFRLGKADRERLREQVTLLRELGCDILIHSMHCGLEYAEQPNQAQRDTAEFMAELGVDVVVGHHPHVVQGMKWIGDTLVLYSLGNAVFGGNSHPRDMDALLAQAVFRFEDGEALSMDAELYPIRVSSREGSNDYRPTLLTGEDAERVFAKMESSTGTDAGAYAGENVLSDEP